MGSQTETTGTTERTVLTMEASDAASGTFPSAGPREEAGSAGRPFEAVSLNQSLLDSIFHDLASPLAALIADLELASEQANTLLSTATSQLDVSILRGMSTIAEDLEDGRKVAKRLRRLVRSAGRATRLTTPEGGTPVEDVLLACAELLRLETSIQWQGVTPQSCRTPISPGALTSAMFAGVSAGRKGRAMDDRLAICVRQENGAIRIRISLVSPQDTDTVETQAGPLIETRVGAIGVSTPGAGASWFELRLPGKAGEA